MFYAFILTAIAGLSTLLGSFVILFIKKPKNCYLNVAMGFSAGVMIFISLTEVLGESIASIGYSSALVSFFAGIGIIMALDTLVPHAYEAEAPSCCKNIKDSKKLKKCGMMIALGVAIHNLPEGIAVFFSSLADQELGLSMALAIALHNIPEGIAVAMPIFYATRNRRKAFWLSFLSGVTEPVAAVLSFLVLSWFINETILGVMLGIVAGLMVFISFDELLPFAYQQENNNLTIFGIFAGMAVMALSLVFI